MAMQTVWFSNSARGSSRWGSVIECSLDHGRVSDLISIGGLESTRHETRNLDFGLV
jgi:hypothetical protein